MSIALEVASGGFWDGRGAAMPKNLKVDIDWHRARIAFYEQAVQELAALPDSAEKIARQEGLRTIIADLRHTLADLERVLGQQS
jgi:hypothetical protein